MKVSDFMPRFTKSPIKPRPAATYRGARRNAAKVARYLHEWRQKHANQQSG